MDRLELATLGVGCVLMVVAATLIDYRLGLAVAGVLLILSAFDVRGR